MMSKAGLLLLLLNVAAAPLEPPRFEKVAEGVYRSAQPSGAELAALQRERGLKSVLKLNHGVDAAPPGVKVFSHPLDGLVQPTERQIQQILDEIEAAPKPILIHCTHGEDRTGLVVALYKIRHGESVDGAYADMVRHGFHPWPGLWRYWRKVAGL